jgi:hypothetical protein
MTDSLTMHTGIESAECVNQVSEKLLEMLKNGQRPVVTIEYGAKRRTLTQNRALHQFFTMLAEGLNDCGLDMRKVLKPHIDIPWTGKSVKEYLWRPVQEVMLDEESTAKVSTKDYTPVYQTLARHLATKHGFRVPDWPSRERGYQ